MNATPETTTTETTTAPSEKFPNVPRLFSTSDLGKLLGISPATIANNVMSGIAPEPEFIIGERMVWLDTEVWIQWQKNRETARQRRAAERAEQEAAQLAKLATKIAGSDGKLELLKALLADMSPDQIAALTTT